MQTIIMKTYYAAYGIEGIGYDDTVTLVVMESDVEVAMGGHGVGFCG